MIGKEPVWPFDMDLSTLDTCSITNIQIGRAHV